MLVVECTLAPDSATFSPYPQDIEVFRILSAYSETPSSTTPSTARLKDYPAHQFVRALHLFLSAQNSIELPRIPSTGVPITTSRSLTLDVIPPPMPIMRPTLIDRKLCIICVRRIAAIFVPIPPFGKYVTTIL